MAVFREMCRYPVDNYAYTCLVSLINKVFKFIWVSKSTRWCEHSHGLIAPRTVERKLGNRQQFNVSVTHIADVAY